MCGLTVMALLLLTSTATLLNMNRKNRDRMVCRTTAFSLSDVLSEELCAKKSGEENELQQAVRDMLLGDTDLKHCRGTGTDALRWEYRLEEKTEDIEFRLAVSWGDDNSSFRRMTEELMDEETGTEWNEREMFDGALLYLEAVCRKDGEGYQVERAYSIRVQEKEDGYVWSFTPELQTVGQREKYPEE